MANHYRLEEREDAWVLSLGQRVTGLQLGMQLILQLEGPERASICIEGKFRLTEGCVVRELDPEKPAALGPALAVVHQTIEQAIAFKDGRLQLRFSHSRLISVSPHPQYESWQISAPDASPPLFLVSTIASPMHDREGQD